MADVSFERMFDVTTNEGLRERAAVLALMATKGIPKKHLAGLIEEQGSALLLLESLDQPTGQLHDLEGNPVTLDQLAEQIRAHADERITLVTVLDAAYPANLRMVYDRPAALFISGALTEADRRSVAVVGTRKATERGRKEARMLAAQLARAGYTVISGLAAGIDTAAHAGALDAGGRTVAVIGNGLRHSSPRANAPLQERLGRESAVISQFRPAQEPRVWTFPLRNAVMSGLAWATAVVEASDTSGARMQTELALEHGRPVFLLRPLLEHDWARAIAQRPAVYVVDAADEIVERLDRLYDDELTLTA